ncbi:MAG TPA: 16S rRNA (guanine(527)-N(7))-methyltransferase RsmG [Rhodobacteraceae bacterium]|nr:16S rRNA (guanine(527)-N(7))-methyltransferase RsmG [Paracoccaceae bacterium]
MIKPSATDLDVSRETFERLSKFADLVRKWSPKINLVSRGSMEHLWERHIRDSIQVIRQATPAQSWLDLGSGGGFPGLIAAIVAADEQPEQVVTLVESDQRKAIFLRTAARETGVNCTVLAQRIEQVPPRNADILSARALADLRSLLGHAERHLSPSGLALFPKGASWKKELDEARLQWRFDAEAITSKIEPTAVILKIKGVQRA